MRNVIESVDEVVQAVKRFASYVAEDGIELDLSNVDYQQLMEDIQDEYDCGADGSILDVIVDLNGAVGLDDYGIIFPDYE